MFGLNRSLSKTHSSIKTYILEPLEAHGIGFSLYANFIKIEAIFNERSQEINTKPEEDPHNFLEFEKITYSDQNKIDQSIYWDKVFEFGDTYHQIKSSNIPQCVDVFHVDVDTFFILEKIILEGKL